MTSCQHKFVQEEYDSICELCGARENDVIEAADERRRRLNDITAARLGRMEEL